MDSINLPPAVWTAIVAAFVALSGFAFWLVKAVIRITNKNTEAMTHLTRAIDNMPDKIMDKIKLDRL